MLKPANVKLLQIIYFIKFFSFAYLLPRVIHPVKYYRDFLNHDLRPDGRELDQFRPVVINVDSIGTADGSSIVKIGNTTVVCGIKAVSGPQ